MNCYPNNIRPLILRLLRLFAATLYADSRNKLGCWLAWLTPLLLSSSVFAQWTTQTIDLRPGWNAVYLEVQPEPRETTNVLANLPVETVRRWNRRFNPVQFIENPDKVRSLDPDWLVYLPPSHPLSSQGNLFIIEGGCPYLIKLPENAAPVTWTVRGKPVIRPIDWLSDSLNFVGFNVPGNSPPTFQQFFGGSPAHTNAPVYRLNSSGNWVQASSNEPMKAGEAFWVRCRGQSTFFGPLSVSLPQGNGLDYGRSLVSQTIRIKNNSSGVSSVQLKLGASFPAPDAVDEKKAGEVPIYYWEFDPSKTEPRWKPLISSLTRTNLPPGQEWVVVLEARRLAMASFNPPPGVTNATYQSILEITDSANLGRIQVPVTARGMQDFRGSRPIGLASLKSVAGAAVDRSGLWLGSARITSVSQPASTTPTNVVPVATPLEYRILVHVDGTGTARLLQKVLLMWKTNSTPDLGRFVLVTDEKLIPQFR